MTVLGAPVGRLVLCPTPIGNLQDVTLRVLEALAGADVIACEDTRRSRTLLERHQISARLVSLHEHNESPRAAELCEQIRAGAVVALVSDAGTPLVNDPGYALVRACIGAGLPLEVLPGPTAVTTALLASGLAPDRFRFVGFLPRRRGELQDLLAGPETIVAFESPRRVAASLSTIAEREPERRVAVCRELTKLHEEILRGSAGELAEQLSGRTLRGEVVLVCEGAGEQEADAAEALEAVRELVAAGARPRPAAAAVARLTGLSANRLYEGLTGSGQ